MGLLWLAAALVALWGGIWQWRRRADADPWWWWTTWILLSPCAIVLGAAFPGWMTLTKFATLWVMPSGMIWLTLLAVTWWRREDAALRWVLLTLAALWWLLGNGWVAAAMLRGLEAPYADLTPLTGEQRWDAIIVLGGGTDRDARGQVQLAESGDRLRLAAALWREGRTPVLVVTGSSLAAFGAERDLAGESRELLRQLGVADGAIRSHPAPVNTVQELELLARLLDDEPWQDVAVISSAWHLRRVMGHAERLQLDLDPLPADRRGRFPGPSLLTLVPNDGALRQNGIVIREWLGIAVGR